MAKETMFPAIILCVCLALVQGADPDIEAVFRRLEAVENKERLYELKISQLDQKVSSYEQLVAKLQYESAVKDATLDEHAGRIAALEEENERYRNKLQALIQENNNVDAAHDGREDVVNDGEISDKKLLYNRPATPFDKQGLTKRNNKRFLVDAETGIAFHAVLSEAHEYPHLSNGQPIAFNKVLLNLGNAYHSIHGVFIAPIDGVYVFSTSILSVAGAAPRFDAAITKNGNITAKVLGHGDNSHFDQGSVTVTVDLVANDEVAVEILNTDSSIWGHAYTSFTGFLLFPK